MFIEEITGTEWGACAPCIVPKGSVFCFENVLCQRGALGYYNGSPMVLEEPKALDVQVGGSHYKDLAIQPVEFCQKNQLNHCESSIVKYACRHRNKGRAEDVKKIIHYAQLLLQLEYGVHDEAI